MYNDNYANFFELNGKTIKRISGAYDDNDSVTIETDDGTYNLVHQQDCCESVNIIKVFGDPNDFVNQKVVLAEEDAGAAVPDWFDHNIWCGGGTLTHYSLVAENGSKLDIWWNGVSNGYYSESVTCFKV